MKGQHVDPEEAVKVHQDVRSHKSIGIHWGTFDLACEVCFVSIIFSLLTWQFYVYIFSFAIQPIFEPREKLAECAEVAGLKLDEFVTVQHGKVLFIPASNSTQEETGQSANQLWYMPSIKSRFSAQIRQSNGYRMMKYMWLRFAMSCLRWTQVSLLRCNIMKSLLHSKHQIIFYPFLVVCLLAYNDRQSCLYLGFSYVIYKMRVVE